MQKRCNRNRKRSKRRAIYCPLHGCYLDSVSQKYSLYASQVEHLQQHGVGRRNALMLMASQTAVLLNNEWLEAFWCDRCQKTKWYHVRSQDGTYHISVVPQELWQRAVGTISCEGNPSVGEFTRRQARTSGYTLSQQFKLIS